MNEIRLTARDATALGLQVPSETVEDCTATIDTIRGIITCHRSDGRDHWGWHHYDEIQDGRVTGRIIWNDHEEGYSSLPSARLCEGY